LVKHLELLLLVAVLGLLAVFEAVVLLVAYERVLGR
jgi:hypothetical protein